MLKNILKLKGAQKLSKNDQKSINGGGRTLCLPDNIYHCFSIGGIYNRSTAECCHYEEDVK